MEKGYHYTECGLRRVWLLNGYEWIDTPYGKALSVHDIEGLHQLIGCQIAHKARITGTETRFLRREMGLSQRAMGELFGVTEQAVAKWEKASRIPKTVDRLLRALYVEHADGNVKIRALIDSALQVDEESADDHLVATEDGGRWKLAA